MRLEIYFRHVSKIHSTDQENHDKNQVSLYYTRVIMSRYQINVMY
jgi:hypothetical protein